MAKSYTTLRDTIHGDTAMMLEAITKLDLKALANSSPSAMKRKTLEGMVVRDL
jgi:hypothetical protein